MREPIKVLPPGAIVLPGDKYRYRIAELEGMVESLQERNRLLQEYNEVLANGCTSDAKEMALLKHQNAILTDRNLALTQENEVLSQKYQNLQTQNQTCISDNVDLTFLCKYYQELKEGLKAECEELKQKEFEHRQDKNPEESENRNQDIKTTQEG